MTAQPPSEQRYSADYVAEDEFGRPWICEICGKRMDAWTRAQTPAPHLGLESHDGLIFGHLACLWPEHSDGVEL